MRRIPERARLHDDQGLGLVEVLVALAILAIVMPALAATTFSTLRATQVNDQRSVATNLAQAEIEAAHATGYAELSTNLGRVTYESDPISGITYVVARDTSLAGLDSVADPCVGSGDAADTALARVDVEVRPKDGTDEPVRSSTTVARPAGHSTDPNLGALGVKVQDHQDPPTGVSAALVTITKPSPDPVTRNLSTLASGCVVFTDLPAGSYAITVSKPGYVGLDSSSDPLTSSASVPTGGGFVQAPEFNLAPAARVLVDAAPRFAVDAELPEDLQVTVNRDGLPVRRDRGTFTPGLWPATWQVWAGNCRLADPAEWSPPRDRQDSATLTPGDNAVVAELDVLSLWLAPTSDQPIDWPVTVTATTSDCGSAGTPELRFPEVVPPGPEPELVQLALPYGVWEVLAVDGAGRAFTAEDLVLDRAATEPLVAVAPEGLPG